MTQTADPSSSKQVQMDTNTFHKTHKCNYCGKLFTYVGYMRRLGTLFDKIKSCGKSFTQADFLRRHITLVSNLRELIKIIHKVYTNK